MKKNVVILTEGGKDMGFGHVTRCLSLAQAFCNRAGDYSCRFIINGDESVNSVMGDFPFTVLDWANDKELSFLEDDNVVIVDSYLARAETYDVICQMAGTVLYLDDTIRLDYPSGAVVNWSIAALEMDYPAREEIDYLLGPEYVSMRKPFWNLGAKPVSEEVSSVMITFGGDDSKNITPDVLKWLVWEYPGLTKNIIVGNAFKNRKQIEAVLDGKTNMILSPGAQCMKEVMQRSDIAISSGGQTLYELACVGVPAVVVAVAENQMSNVAGWRKTGFIEDAGFWTDPELMDSIRKKFEILSQYQRRIKAIAEGHAAVPGNGADRIIDYVESRDYTDCIY